MGMVPKGTTPGAEHEQTGMDLNTPGPIRTPLAKPGGQVFGGNFGAGKQGPASPGSVMKPGKKTK